MRFAECRPQRGDEGRMSQEPPAGGVAECDGIATRPDPRDLITRDRPAIAAGVGDAEP